MQCLNGQSSKCEDWFTSYNLSEALFFRLNNYITIKEINENYKKYTKAAMWLTFRNYFFILRERKRKMFL